MITEYASGAVVYQIKDNEILYLLLQSATSDFWGIPKGHVEAGEDLVATAIREIKEETGIDAQIDEGFQEKVEYDMKNGHHKDVTFFVSQVSNKATVKRQVAEIKDDGWFTFVDAKERLTYDNLKDILIDANRYINQKEHLGGHVSD